MTSRPRRRRVESTDDWEQLKLLSKWPEQAEYEFIRPIVLSGGSAAERAAETGAASERTLQRKIARFEVEGMESLFGSEPKRHRRLPPSTRRLIVDLKAEYPSFNLNEVSAIATRAFGTGASTARRRRWPDTKRHCGSRRRASPWNTAGSSSRATISSS
jgi:hypothetical protein